MCYTMEPETELNDLKLSGAYSEEINQPSFANLVESDLENPLLTACLDINSVRADKVHTSHFEKNPSTEEKNSSSKSTCADLKSETFSKVASQQSFESPVVKSEVGSQEVSLKVEKNCTPTNQDNTSEIDQPLKPIPRRRGRPRKCKSPTATTCSDQEFGQQTPELLQFKNKSENQELSLVEENSNQDSTKLDESSNSIPKGRGRQSKHFKKDLKPTRGSTRKRKCPEVISYNRQTKLQCMWSDKDKRKLLKGLQEVGSENIKTLHMEYLPDKTESEITSQIKMWKEFAGIELEKKLITEKKMNDCAMVNCVTKLDEWIKYFAGMEEVSGNKLFALSNVFLLISEYGNFPPPAECNNIDFRAMYRYIHCMLNGIPYYGVNRMTAKVLNDSISDMFAVLREHQQIANLQPHLYNNLLKGKPRCLTYGRPTKRGVGMLKNPDAIMNLPDINPLNIPPHILSKPEIEEYEYDEDDDTVYVSLDS